MGLIDNSTFNEHIETLPRLEQLDEQTIRARAAAKINLTLAVGAERPDGYHAFESLMATISLCDELLIRRGERGIRVECEHPHVPTDSRNLVYRAASLLAWYGKISPAVEIDLLKRIPTEAGLGGASADAAAALLALNQLWNLDLTVTQLSEIASVLGSDVAFFLSGPIAVCLGRGEQVEPVETPWPFWAVVIQPSSRLSTREVYKYHRLSDSNSFGLASRLAEQLLTNTPSELSQHFRNDLEPAAFRVDHELDQLRSALERSCNVPVRLSGSGSAMFALFDDHDQAVQFMRRIAHLYPELANWLVRNNSW